jgi:hypothetical protein
MPGDRGKKNDKFIPVGQPWLGAKKAKAVARVIESGW